MSCKTVPFFFKITLQAKLFLLNFAREFNIQDTALLKHFYANNLNIVGVKFMKSSIYIYPAKRNPGIYILLIKNH